MTKIIIVYKCDILILYCLQWVLYAIAATMWTITDHSEINHQHRPIIQPDKLPTIISHLIQLHIHISGLHTLILLIDVIDS